MFSLRVYIAPVVFVVLVAGYLFYEPGHDNDEVLPMSKQQGVCWVGLPQKITAAEILEVKERGVDWISQTPFGWLRHASDTLVQGENATHTPWWGESWEGIAETTRLAQRQGIQTLLKPHLWVRDSWPGEVEMASPTDWEAWFRNYEQFILPYARLADSTGIRILCIGTELHKTVQRPEWRQLIKRIRAVYSGELTYAANFHDEFEEIPFWDDLDYIGIQAYFPLSKDRTPGVTELRQGWKEPIRNIRKVHEKFGKPVLFTELGYRSTPDAAIDPWRWPQKEEEVSVETQSNCYEAFFQSVWQERWIAGVYFWKWYPHPPRRSMPSDFTPQGKPAAAVMQHWFVRKGQ